MTNKPTYQNRIVGHGEESLDQVIFNPSNWRIHPKAQQTALNGVLDEVGWVQEVIINRTTGNLVDGHLRCTLAARKGQKTIPVTYVELSEAEEKLILATLDPIGSMAAADKAQLNDLFDMIDTDNEDIQKALEEIAKKEKLGTLDGLAEPPPPQVDLAAELQKKWGTETGQLWKLGDHRILCGDSTNPLNLERLLQGTRATMMFTDPPYLMNYRSVLSRNAEGSLYSREIKKIENDNLDDAEGGLFLARIAQATRDHVSGAWYICFYHLGIHQMINALEQQGLQYRNLIIWHKNGLSLSTSDYKSTYEPILYGWNQDHNFYGRTGETDMLKAKRDPQGNPSITTQGRALYLKAGKNYYRFERVKSSPKIYIDINDGPATFNLFSGENDIWEIDRTKKNDLHPTMKPLELCERAIKNSSLPKETVLDLFLGSGSTLIAADRLHRHARGIEMDPGYIAVTIQRWVDETGGTPELETDGAA